MKRFLYPIIDCSLEDSKTIITRVIGDTSHSSIIKVEGDSGILYQLKNGDAVVLVSSGSRVILYQVVFDKR